MCSQEYMLPEYDYDKGKTVREDTDLKEKVTEIILGSSFENQGEFMLVASNTQDDMSRPALEHTKPDAPPKCLNYHDLVKDLQASSHIPQRNLSMMKNPNTEKPKPAAKTQQRSRATLPGRRLIIYLNRPHISSSDSPILYL